MNTGAAQLRDWMDRRGFNQAETAQFFDWSEAFISLLVNGRRAPSLANAVKIEAQTGIPVSAWLSSSNDNSEMAVTGIVRKAQPYNK